MAYAKAVANSIQSDLKLLMKGLEAVASSSPMQNQLYTGEREMRF